MWRLVWLAVLLVTLAPDVYAERLPIKTYTTADGLAHNTINRIVRDSRGYLWFCTADGLSRFDGYAFKNFGTADGLPHAFVSDLLETRSGEYWVATLGGLVRFDPTGRPGRDVVHVEEAAASGPMFALLAQWNGNGRTGAITVLREGANGTIWVGTTTGLFRVEQADGHRILRSVDIGLPLESLEGREIGWLQFALDLRLERSVSTLARWRRGTLRRTRRHAGRPPNEPVHRS
jgi:ligand-binding sensor domain-containing protein